MSQPDQHLEEPGVRPGWTRWWPAALVGGIVAVALISYRAPADGESVRLFFTATVTGHVEPCGCRINPSGGMARRAGYIESNLPDSGGALVLLDGGDLLGPPTPEGRLQTEYQFRAMKVMGYTVLGLGARDFLHGIDFLRECERRFDFSFTSANAAFVETGLLPFPPFIKTWAGRGSVLGIPYGGMEIAVISVMGDDELPDYAEGEPAIGVIDPVTSARRAAELVRKDVELVVVLAGTNQQAIDSIMTIPDVDVVIASRTLHQPQGYSNVGQRGHAALGYSGYQGRRLGQMDLTLGEDGRVASVSGDLIWLGEDVPDDPTVAAVIDEYKVFADREQ